MSIVSLSHSDLDGISSQIVLRAKFGEITRMNLSYGKIQEYLEILDEHCSRLRPNKVFVTDLSFSYEELKKLNEIAHYNPEVQFYFIDHHPFEENNGDYSGLILPNLKIVISDKACATKLTMLYLKSNFGLVVSDELEKFVSYVNGYDIWQEGTPEFKVGFVYNELFWEYKMAHFWSKFKDNYKLRAGDKEVYKDLIKKKDKLFAKLEKSGRVMKFEKRILLIFIDTFQGHVTLDYPDFLSYVIIRSNGGVSVRLKSDAVNDGLTKNNIVQKVLNSGYVENAGGHHAAFGTMVTDGTAHNMVEFSKLLVTYIDEELEAINL